MSKVQGRLGSDSGGLIRNWEIGDRELKLLIVQLGIETYDTISLFLASISKLVGGFFIPREVVLKTSLRFGESEPSIIRMKDRLESLNCPLYVSYSKKQHKVFAHMAHYPIWDVLENCGIMIIQHKKECSHKSAIKVGFDGRRLPQFKKSMKDERVDELIETLLGA